MNFEPEWLTKEEITTDGFQVVSSKLFSSYRYKSELSCTLWINAINFTKKAVEAFNCCERIRIEVNSEKRCILITPVTEKDRDGIVWIKKKRDQATGKKLECRAFTSQLFKLWGWDENEVYRTTGKLVTVDNKIMMLFDFSNPEHWETRVMNKDKDA